MKKINSSEYSRIILIFFHFYLSLFSIVFGSENKNFRLYSDASYLTYEYKADNQHCKDKNQLVEDNVLFMKNYFNKYNPYIYTSDENLKNEFFNDFRKLADNWSCKFENFHVRNDSNKNTPSMVEILNFIKQVAKNGGKVFSISGSQKYYKLFKHKYFYDIEITPSEKTIIRLNIQFNDTKISKNEAVQFRAVLQNELEIWNNSFPEKFVLEVKEVSQNEFTHYKVRLQDKHTAAIYNSFWPSFMEDNTYAHEIGHMLGLNEEYNVMTTNVFSSGKKGVLADELLAKSLDDQGNVKSFLSNSTLIRDHKCLLISIVCLASDFVYGVPGALSDGKSSLKPQVMPYHFYNILRRLPL